MPLRYPVTNPQNHLPVVTHTVRTVTKAKCNEIMVADAESGSGTLPNEGVSRKAAWWNTCQNCKSCDYNQLWRLVFY